MNGVSANEGELRQQLRLACTELQRRLLTGESCSAEQLLAEYPDLALHDELALDLICTEYELRIGRGEKPTADEWCSRFPQWRERLQSRLQVLVGFSESRWIGDETVPELRSSPDPQPTSSPSTAWQTFAHYQLQEELGHGGMGVVHRAWDTVLRREVALKRLRPEVLGEGEEVQRFHREAQAAARLRHPHIVPLLEFGEHEGQHYYTMPLLTGGSLAQKLGGLAGDLPAAVRLVEKVGRAMQAAHEAGIIHRDLKPTNILLDEQGEPLVADFGLAKLADVCADLTQTGRILGTPAYMAPEQASGHANEVTAQTDVWALGVILYELLTGQRPFPGRTLKEVTLHILADDPPRPRTLRRGLDRSLETIVLKCLEKQPARRYLSAGELAADLDRWRRGEPIQARPLSWPRRAGRWLRRHQRLTLLAVLCVFLAVAAAGVSHFLDPKRNLYPLEQRLRKGEAVSLLDDKGRPAWFRWVLGAGHIDHPLEEPEALSLVSLDPCLLELLPDPQRESFRFRAEVFHKEGTVFSEVGLYFGYSQHATPGGVDHYYCRLTFNDKGRPANPGPGLNDRTSYVALWLERLSRPGSGGSTSPAFPKCGELIDPAPQWRQLIVDVRPDQVQCTWGKRRYPPVARATLLKWRSKIVTPDLNPEPAFAPRQGLGLFIRDGKAWFRRVRVEPLD